MDDGTSGAEIDLRPGQSYYLKVEIVPGFWKGGGKMTYVAPEQGGRRSRGSISSTPRRSRTRRSGPADFASKLPTRCRNLPTAYPSSRRAVGNFRWAVGSSERVFGKPQKAC